MNFVFGVDRTPIRQGSVLGFSANRVWLVSRFFHISIYFIFLHFNLINIQCPMDSLHNLPSGSSAGWIVYIICRPAALRTDCLHNLPSGSDGKLCRLSVRQLCRTDSLHNLPFGCRTDSHCLYFTNLGVRP